MIGPRRLYDRRYKPQIHDGFMMDPRRKYGGTKNLQIYGGFLMGPRRIYEHMECQRSYRFSRLIRSNWHLWPDSVEYIHFEGVSDHEEKNDLVF